MCSRQSYTEDVGTEREGGLKGAGRVRALVADRLEGPSMRATRSSAQCGTAGFTRAVVCTFR